MTNTRLRWSLVPLLFVAAVILGVITTGCENDEVEGDTTDAYFSSNPYKSESRIEPDAATVAANSAETAPVVSNAVVEAVVVDPAAATLSADGETKVFKVTGGVPPYTWGVHDVFLGKIISTGSASAVYQRSAAGFNYVSVTDSAGTKIFANVTQP